MEFSKTIKALRQKADMTQERLAEVLSVSPQAVSRWETGTAMPDVSLFAPIANLFEVTTDYLLNVDISKKNDRINEIIKEAQKAGCDNNADCSAHSEALEVLRRGLKLYPESRELKIELVGKMRCVYNSEHDNEKFAYLIREIDSTCEDIIANCTDESIKREAILEFCLNVKHSGNTERAKEFANSMPKSICSRESLLTYVLSGSELEEHLHDHINECVCKIDDALFELAQDKPPEQVAALYKKNHEYQNVLYENDDFVKSQSFYDMEHRWALTFAKAGDYTCAAEILTRDYERYLDIIENGFAHFSGLVPPLYLWDMQTNFATVEIRQEEYSRYAGEIPDSLSNEFPEEFKQTTEYTEIFEKFKSLALK